jgi:hypothetical protein
VVEGLYQQTNYTDTNRRAFAGDRDWTDYSFSFMMRTDDPTGSMGGYVRQYSTGTADTGYLFRWQNNGMRLEQRNPYSLLDSNNVAYAINRWYHVEIRVTRDSIEVFVDGTRYLSAVTTTHSAGRVGLLSSSQTRTDFDDILVTRLGNQSCYVGANDWVTYTLTISNHQTVNAGISKTVTFSPPPTATLGTLVTYTLIIPDHPISATLYNVAVTDTIDSRMQIVAVTAHDTSWSYGWSGQVVTATFASIPHDTQAYVTITARISHEWPSPAGDANAGDVLTDVARMSHATAPVTKQQRGEHHRGRAAPAGG